MTRKTIRPIILLAEDSDDDAFFFRWALQKNDLKCELVRAYDGMEAVDYLKKGVDASGRRNAECPDLVFLDLKMPACNGFEVLEWIRANPFDPPLDVAVLSGSEHAVDFERATKLGATAYYVKPMSAAHLRARFNAWQQQQAQSQSAQPSSQSTAQGVRSGPA
ncbi:MAG: response regulator [Verrucomicrobiota bacterium]